jgi:hypothetical protein
MRQGEQRMQLKIGFAVLQVCTVRKYEGASGKLWMVAEGAQFQRFAERLFDKDWTVLLVPENGWTASERRLSSSRWVIVRAQSRPV